MPIEPGRELLGTTTQSIAESPDIQARGIYTQGYLAELVVEHAELPETARDGVIASICRLAAEQTVLLPQAAWRHLVVPSDADGRRHTLHIAGTVDRLVRSLEGSQNLPFADCYDVADRQGLWPKDEADQLLFSRLFETHLRVAYDETGTTLRHTRRGRNTQVPTTISEAVALIHEGLETADILTTKQLLHKSGAAMLEDLTEAQSKQLLQALKDDPRMNYLGTANRDDYFFPEVNAPGAEVCAELVRAANALGDMLAMRGLDDAAVTKAGIPCLMHGEAQRLAVQEGLLPDDVSQQHAQTFVRALKAHPAIDIAPFVPGSGRRGRMVLVLGAGAERHRSKLFPAIPPMRQRQLMSSVSHMQRCYAEQRPADKTIIAKLAVEDGLAPHEHDFILQCVLPRTYGWRQTRTNQTQKKTLAPAGHSRTA